MPETIYLITNRNLNEDQDGFGLFGDGFNAKGPKELRLVSAEREPDGKISLSIVPDGTRTNPASKLKFKQLQKTMREEDRNCVFFVHGYNNNLQDAVRAAYRIRDLYHVEVILFSWPSNGGGLEENRPSRPLNYILDRGEDAHGLASYLSDKHDAELSKGALDRVFQKLSMYLNDPKLMKSGDRICEKKITLLCHSMGNYLLKKLATSSIYHADSLMFDNIVLCAADVNNAGHEQWVSQLAHRKRLYVTINENDFALKWSRRKMGDRQRARLGHYTKNLVSPLATYLDFTEAIGVDNSHGYFADKATENRNVFDAFYRILNGERCEPTLDYNAVDGTYTVV